MNRSSRSRLAAACGFAGLAAVVAATGGCGDAAGDPSTRPSSADQALADPMNYGPRLAPPDKKDAKPAPPPADRDSLKRDLNNVFNP